MYKSFERYASAAFQDNAMGKTRIALRLKESKNTTPSDLWQSIYATIAYTISISELAGGKPVDKAIRQSVDEILSLIEEKQQPSPKMVELDKVIALLEEAKTKTSYLIDSNYNYNIGRKDAINDLINKIKSL